MVKFFFLFLMLFTCFQSLRQGPGVRILELSGSPPRAVLLVLENRLLSLSKWSLQVHQVKARKFLARDLAPPVVVIAVVIAQNAEEAVELLMTQPALPKNQHSLMRLDQGVNLMLANESPVL